MLNLLENIIDETKDDDKLFVRYGFKFVDCIENYPKESRNILDKKPNFLNDFQLIFLSGIVEHFFHNDKPGWVSDKKLKKPWGYLSGYNITDEEKCNNKYYDELVERGIFAI